MHSALLADGGVLARRTVPHAAVLMEAERLVEAWRQRCLLADGTGLRWVHQAQTGTRDVKELEASVVRKVPRDLYRIVQAG